MKYADVFKVWDGNGFDVDPAGSQSTDPYVVDSYLVLNGRVIGLHDHEQRFSDSLPQGVPQGFFDALRAELPKAGAWFPRIQWTKGGQLGFTLREAPPRRTSSQLWLSDLVDPRLHPLLKGPDLDNLGKLRGLASDFRCDDALLVDLDGVVLEAANAAVVFWRDINTVVLPAREVLPSVTVKRTIPLWENAGIKISYADTKRLDLPAWCASSLHGWTPVTAWGRGVGKITAAPAPSVNRWNQALWKKAEKL